MMEFVLAFLLLAIVVIFAGVKSVPQGQEWTVERFGRFTQVLKPGLGMIVSVPFYILAFTTHNLWLCLVGLCIGGMSKYGYLTGQYTIGQGVVSAQFRAVSIAILLFVVNLLGYGLGPLFIGALSDFLFHLQANAMGAAELTRKACEGAGPASLSAELQAVCKVVHPQSLQRSMLITSAMYAVGGGCFILSCRWLQRDMVAK